MKVPRLLIVLSLLTAAYFPCAYWLDRDPEDRPLEDPYRMLVRLERDGVLRSSHFGDVARARQAGMVRSWHFETERDTLSAVQARAGAQLRHVEHGLTEASGSLEVLCPAEARGFVLELPPSPATTGAVVVEGRLRACGQDWEARLALGAVFQDSWIEPTAAGQDEISPTLVASPWTEGLRVEALGDAAESGPMAEGDWLDFRLALRLPLADSASPRPPCQAVRLFVETSTASVEFDELRLRPGSRVDGLLARGHARGFGTTETTWDLKRMVARGADERLCLLMPAPTTLTYELSVPRDAHLDLATSALADASSFGSAVLNVALRRPGEFEQTLLRAPVGTVDVSRFTPHRIELSRYSGETVELQFRVSTTGERRPPVVLLADPVLRSSTTERSLPHVFLVTYTPDSSASNPVFADRESADPFRLLEARGIPLTRITPASEKAPDDLLALLSSREVQPAAAGTRPDPEQRIHGLASTLAENGYRNFAATSTARTGWLLQGFARRWNGALSSEVDGALRWFDRYRESPCFAWIQLPRHDTSRSLRQLVDALEGREVFEECVLVVWPEASKGEAAILCPPGPSGRQRQLDRPFSTLDLAPTLLRLLDLPADASFSGRSWSLDALAGDAEPEAAAPALRGPRQAWHFGGQTLPRLETAIFDQSSEDRRR